MGDRELGVGSYVFVRSLGVLGFIAELTSPDFARVRTVSGDRWVQVTDLEPAPASPDDAFSRGFLAEDVGRFLLRERAIHLRWAYEFDPVFGLSNARIELKPYQVFTALRVLRKSKPRMILADEVGLGKTIEAGLILRELRARGVLERLLIVCPASLVTQWHRELKTKFNEECQIYDGSFVRHLRQQDENGNPWMKHNAIITSIALARRPEHAESIAAADWDVVLFDEAHHVRLKREGGERVPVRAYRLAESLADQVYGLLLLTATPMQLDPFEFYGLVQLVAPGLFADYRAFEAQRWQVAELNLALRGLEAFPFEVAGMERGLPEVVADILGQKPRWVEEQLESTVGREHLIDEVCNRHLLSHVMIRNRKRVLDEASRREPVTLSVTMTQEERALYDEVSEYIQEVYGRAQGERNVLLGFVMTTYRKILASSSHALGVALGRRAAKLEDEWFGGQQRAAVEPEMTVEDLADFGEEDSDVELSELVSELDSLGFEADGDDFDPAPRVRREIELLRDLQRRAFVLHDSKLTVLLRAADELLEADSREKMLIFTQFIETQNYLSDHLGAKHSVVLFNGKMSAEEKDKAWRRFKDDASIMVLTEAGGEGRNFQFAHILVNYDLPWNPMKVEQRIGRLDRIGQTHRVRIYNFSIEDTVEDRVLELLQHRIGLFEETIGGLDPILGDLERNIRDIVFSPPGEHSQKLDDLEEQMQLRVERARRMEEEMGDFILDRRSFRSDEADRLLGRTPAATHVDLERFVTDQLAEFPPDRSGPRLRRSGQATLNMAVPAVLQRKGLGEEYVGTFSPKVALEEEGLDFFAFGHPLVDVFVERAQTREYVFPAAAFKVYDDALASFEGFRFLFEIVVRSAVSRDQRSSETRTLLEVWLTEDGELRDDLTGLIRRPDLRVEPVPFGDHLARALEAVRPGAIGFAIRESQRQGADQAEQWERLYDEEVLRIERLRDWRLAKLEHERDQEEETIERLRSSTRPEDQRVLPAREGLLRKTLERIERARLDYDEAWASLGERGKLSLNFDPLSVAYVEVIGSSA